MGDSGLQLIIARGTPIDLLAQGAGKATQPVIASLSLRAGAKGIVVRPAEGMFKEFKELGLHGLTIRKGGAFEFDYDLSAKGAVAGLLLQTAIYAILLALWMPILRGRFATAAARAPLAWSELWRPTTLGVVGALTLLLLAAKKVGLQLAPLQALAPQPDAFSQALSARRWAWQPLALACRWCTQWWCSATPSGGWRNTSVHME